MDLLEELRAARAQTASTLGVLDGLVERVSRLAAALAPEGPGPVKASNGANGATPRRVAVPAVLPDSTRDRVLAAASDWLSFPDLARALGSKPNRSAIHSMLGTLVKEGAVKRRGSGRSHEYRRVDGAEPKKRRNGLSRSRVLALVPDWTNAADVHTRLMEAGMSRGQISAAIRSLVAAKQLQSRGAYGSRELKAKG